MKCAGCGVELDKRGRNRSGKCRRCRPLVERLSPADVYGLVRTAPTAWLVRALQARGVHVVEEASA